MAKCGKGCMPECEYFTTGGCISPFNCPYRIEELSPNSATSISSTYVQNLISENAALKSENAALQKRLEKAVELPCVPCIKTWEWLNRERLGDIMLEWCVIYENGGWIVVEPCLSKEAAESRLAELKGDKNDR